MPRIFPSEISSENFPSEIPSEICSWEKSVGNFPRIFVRPKIPWEMAVSAVVAHGHDEETTAGERSGITRKISKILFALIPCGKIKKINFID